MKYDFHFTDEARAQLRQIQKKDALRILEKLALLGDDPYQDNNNVTAMQGYADRYRLRVGNYRVVYRIIDGELVILVIGVGVRGTIYRNM